MSIVSAHFNDVVAVNGRNKRGDNCHQGEDPEEYANKFLVSKGVSIRYLGSEAPNFLLRRVGEKPQDSLAFKIWNVKS